MIIESHARMLSTVGIDGARTFAQAMQPGKTTIIILRPKRRDDRIAREILSLHRDKDYSLCDAISFAVMQLRGMTLAFSFDHHFRQFGFSTPGSTAEWP